MRNSTTILILTVFLLLGFTARTQSKKFKVDKEPAWVTVNSINYFDPNLDHEAEDGYMDTNYEKQVNLSLQTTYFKKAIKIISEAGVQNSSEISIAFDPSYEQLTFHSIRIMRNKEWLNKLQTDKIKIIQQETELDRHIYDQSLSAVLILEDVRIGDIIEYSYSVKGFNTIFKGKYADSYGIGFTVPVNNLFYKIIVPSGKELVISPIGSSIQPVIDKNNSETAYQWSLKNVPAMRLQDKLPSWYDPYPSIRVSEYKSWKEVNDWAMELFPDINLFTPEMERIIREVRIKNDDAEKQVLQLLRFVQDDIRYMGFEMGENSHKPFPPGKILAQRFGDCKDKAYLLCTMLRALEIEANPVLVNTGYKRTIRNWLPSPTVFDHAIVQVKLNNKTFYFDATIPYQRGTLEAISFPNYQCGLVINKNSTDLMDISMNERGIVRVKEIFTIPDMSGIARLKVITKYSGSFADDIRNSFKNNSQYEMLKKFRDYYSPYYEKIKGDSLRVHDNENSGVFTTEEFYSISDLWKLEGGKKKAQFESFVINGLLSKPADVDRQMPFSISFPAWYMEDVEINLPEEWDASQSTNTVKCDNFFMKCNYSYSNKKIMLKYEYKSYKDNVSPAEAADYFKSYEKATKLAYKLSWGAGTENTSETIDIKRLSDPKNLLIMLIGVVVVVGVIGFIIWRIIKA